MRLWEIFPDLAQSVTRDYDAAIKRATQTTLSGKRQRKQAELGKSKQVVAKKQKELSALDSIKST